MNPRKPWLQTASSILGHALAPIPTEPNELDWKSGLSPKSDRLTAHLSAFANYPGGGFLVFGIDSSGAIAGIDEKQASDIAGQLANIGRDGLEPPIALDHAIVDWEGRNLLFVCVPEQRNKPVHRRGKSVEETWIRSAGTTRKASLQEIGAMLLHGKPLRWEDLRTGTRLPLAEALSRLDLAAVANLLQRPLPGDDRQTWAAEEGLLELEGDGAYITNFGAIAAARDLRQFDPLDRKGIRVIRYRGLNKVQSIDEQLGRRGYAVGFEGLIRQLKLILPHSEVIGEALRTETSVYPEIALRELIANAIIHQDFTITGAGPLIDIFDNRIEFTSPGALLPGKEPDRLIGTTPMSRNERLAKAFRRYRLCEERGTGFQKVVTLVELYGLPPVGFLAEPNAFKVILYTPRGFAEMSQSERIEAAYQHAVLKYVSSGSMTNATLRERLKMNEWQRNQVTGLIADAIVAGRIKRKDPNSGNKFAEYIPYWA